MQLKHSTRVTPPLPGDVRIRAASGPQLVCGIDLPPDDGFAARSPQLHVIVSRAFDPQNGELSGWTVDRAWMSRESEETLALDGG